MNETEILPDPEVIVFAASEYRSPMKRDELLRILQQARDAQWQELDLQRVGIEALPGEIGQLCNLQVLSLNGNQLQSLPPEIGQLRNLQTLDLTFNQLKELPQEIGQLQNLQVLCLSINQLVQLPEQLSQLRQLRSLHLDNNRLEELPDSIGQLPNLQQLYLNGNPLSIPPELLGKPDNPAALMQYYRSARSNQTRPLNEAKMLLVGQGSVGKSSLVNRLLHNTFNPHERKTDGIAIQRWQMQADKRTIQLNVWDFGGQEIMHATHQFFLTQRSLYLLVLDARLGEDQNRLEYWLKIIQSFGGDAPVIVVGNKVDQQRLDLDRRGLRRKYGNIRAFVETSCETEQGIDKLKGAIAQEIGKLPHVKDELPLPWFEIKAQLEQTRLDYLPHHQYQHICRERGVTDALSQQALLGFLHDLGVVLSFRDDPRLEETNILNPAWVTNGVYRILNDNALMTEHKGILERQMLDRILDPQRYPRNKQLFVVDMMRKFELCFNLDGGAEDKFLIPDLLSKEEPYTGEWQDALAFQYHYSILPGSIISRFIVRCDRAIYQKTYWRNGVVLAHEGNKALVKADREDKKICVWVGGPAPGQRKLLAIIRSHFNHIHSTLAGIQATEKVPLSGHPDIVLDYQNLLVLEAMGEKTWVVPQLLDRVPLKPLLDGIEAAPSRRQQAAEVNAARKSLSVVPPPPKSSWRIGSFYLFALAFNTAIFAILYHCFGLVALPIIALAVLLSLGLISILQLFQGGTLSEAGFLQLMAAFFKNLQQFGQGDKTKLPPEDTGDRP